MTPLQDLFVGLVAIAFGCALALGALLNATPLMKLAKPRLLAEALGKTTARWIIGAVGAALVAMGVLIASGWRVGQVFNLP
jgi:hypothetical protein